LLKHIQQLERRNLFSGVLSTLDGIQIEGTYGDDVISVSRWRDRQDRVQVVINGEVGVWYVPAAGSIKVNLHNGADVLIARGVSIAMSIEAGEGNDHVYGGDANDVIRGGEGDDTLWGAGGRDRVYGGAGDDAAAGGGSNDTLYGDDGRDRLDGGRGNDRLSGDAGADRCNGEQGDDVIIGGEGRDRLAGGEGSDWFPDYSGTDLYADVGPGESTEPEAAAPLPPPEPPSADPNEVNINVDFGESFYVPPDTYAAAGKAGTWNSVERIGGPDDKVWLKDTQGRQRYILSSSAPVQSVFPQVSTRRIAERDERLLSDHASAEASSVTIKVRQLPAGYYKVLVYSPILHEYPSISVKPFGQWELRQSANGNINYDLAAGRTYAVFEANARDGALQFEVSSSGGGSLSGMQIIRLGEAIDEPPPKPDLIDSSRKVLVSQRKFVSFHDLATQSSGQSFVSPADMTLRAIRVHATASHGGSAVTVQVYEFDRDTFATARPPLLASGRIQEASFITQPRWLDAVLDKPLALKAGKSYAFMLVADDRGGIETGWNNYAVAVDNPYADGEQFNLNNLIPNPNTYPPPPPNQIDLAFELLG
jgi:hypothetical protein